MPADLSLRNGNLDESLAQLQQQVRLDPSDSKQRIFLFQLLAVMGDWDRALTQLNVVSEMDAGTLAMAQTYREAIKCEVLRKEIFAGRVTPMIFGEPEQWIALLMEALRLTAEGRHEQSQKLREMAFEAAPATSGTMDGRGFQWIADADRRLGPILEAVINGRYYWVPFHRIRMISLEEPHDLRDVVWMPAHFAWDNGGEAVGLVPSRYPGSESSSDSQIRLGRRTDWVEHEAEMVVGMGQRMLITDEDEHPIMDVRTIRFETPIEAAPE